MGRVQSEFSAEPVAVMRRGPADHDLIGVLVPEEVDPHAIPVFVKKKSYARLYPTSIASAYHPSWGTERK
jgi:hypothetical protein